MRTSHKRAVRYRQTLESIGLCASCVAKLMESELKLKKSRKGWWPNEVQQKIIIAEWPKKHLTEISKLVGCSVHQLSYFGKMMDLPGKQVSFKKHWTHWETLYREGKSVNAIHRDYYPHVSTTSIWNALKDMNVPRRGHNHSRKGLKYNVANNKRNSMPRVSENNSGVHLQNATEGESNNSTE